MGSPSVTLATGVPRFAEPRLAEIVRANGISAAWSEAADTNRLAAACAGAGGDFAVCVTRDDSTFIAVDRFGIRSLCYRIISGRLHVAERADELARIPPIADIDPQALFDYLYFHVIPSPRTVFSDIQRLPAGHCATFANGHVQVERYWTPQFRIDDLRPFAASAEEFKRLLRSAVESDLDGTRPACFLSGGTDSSTVAGMIAAVAGRSHTYSIGFEAEGYDEMAFARIAARHFGTDHHEYYVTPDDVAASLPAIATQFDQPFGNSSALPAYYCARMAGEDGVTRLLAGDGGDELFGGNTRYAKQKVFEWYGHLPARLRSGALEPALLRSGLGKLPLARKAASYVEQARVPLPQRLQTYNLLARLGTSTVLTPDFLARVDQDGPAVQQAAVWREVSASSAVDRMLAFDWRYTLAESDLPKVIGATGLAKVAVGFPFLNRDLVDFSTTLPAEYKVRRLKLRWFFKEALRDFLPKEILRKRKQGFGLPFGPWTTCHAGLQRLAADSLRSLATRNVITADFIDRLLRQLLPVHPGFYGELVWILIVLEQWLRHNQPHYRA